MLGKRPQGLGPSDSRDGSGGGSARKLQRVENGHLKSRVIKRSLVVGGHKTSVSLEDAFWNELRAIAQRRHMHLSQLVGSIDAERQHCNLSSAIRLFVFEQCRTQHDAGERAAPCGDGGARPQRST